MYGTAQLAHHVPATWRMCGVYVGTQRCQRNVAATFIHVDFTRAV